MSVHIPGESVNQSNLRKCSLLNHTQNNVVGSKKYHQDKFLANVFLILKAKGLTTYFYINT